MDWNCAFTEERLSEYLDGKLTPEEAAAFSAHAAGCASCAQLAEQVGGIVSRIQKLEMLEEPPQLAAKILEATLGPRKQSEGVQRWFGWAAMLWRPRFTMGLATVAACCILVFYVGGVKPSRLKKADLSPANFLHTANRQAHLTYARSVKFVNDLRVVYEIQSKLQPEPESAPASTPAPTPQQENNSQTPNTNPQQKSQTEPHPGRSQVQHGTMFAFVLTDAWAGNMAQGMFNNAARSPR